MSASTDARADRIASLISRGEYLAAYDESLVAAADDTLDEVERARLGYLRALTLARAGSTAAASRELDAVLVVAKLDDLPVAMSEDLAALRARLAKDDALARQGKR